MGVRDAHPGTHGTHARWRLFEPPRQSFRTFLTEAAFKVLRLQNGELMRVGVGLSPLERPFANTALKERLCS
ncbi:hypothetical protein AK973_3739 [Pseudomonas brassicacearum]|nr:hypothetical protein AK973_3739 [Pseudomonas brassicacearum]